MARFADVLEDVTKDGHKIPKENYLANGLYPIIDQGQEYIAGYSNDADGLYSNVPAIIFGDHTRIIKYVDMPFFLGADGVKLLRAKNPNANYKYLYYALSNANIPNTGYNRHFKWLKEIDIPIPAEPQQASIVKVLDKVNDLIALRKQQLDKLDELVKARFVEIFGDPKTNPQNWPVACFKDVCSLITDGEHVTPKRVANGIYLLSARNVLNHELQLNDVDYIDQDEYDRIAKRVVPQPNDILISCSGSIGRCCRVPQGIKFQMVRSVALLRFSGAVNPVFMENLILTSHLQEQIKQSATQSSQANLFQGRIRELSGYIPPLRLQNEFSAFAEKIGKCKLTVRRGLDKLEMMKKALMQEYFG